MKEKSRDIPQYDWFSNLQLEWLTYYLRSKLYNYEADREKFAEICEKKKIKIDEFSEKNLIDSIFTSSGRLDKCIHEFYSDDNLPKFQYTPKNEFLRKRDSYAFYAKGCDVVYNGYPAKIMYNDYNYSSLKVISNGFYYTVSYSEVRRADYEYLFGDIKTEKNE